MVTLKPTDQIPIQFDDSKWVLFHKMEQGKCCMILRRNQRDGRWLLSGGNGKLQDSVPFDDGREIYYHVTEMANFLGFHEYWIEEFLKTLPALSLEDSPSPKFLLTTHPHVEGKDFCPEPPRPGCKVHNVQIVPEPSGSVTLKVVWETV